MRLYMASRFNI